jgi:hypothetical protein
MFLELQVGLQARSVEWNFWSEIQTPQPQKELIFSKHGQRSYSCFKLATRKWPPPAAKGADDFSRSREAHPKLNAI